MVDNGSGKESQDFLDDIQGEVKVVRNEKNMYWSAACNKGVQAADKNSKYYIFLHCDVVVLNPAWMDLLINVSEAQHSGFVGIDTHWQSLYQPECLDPLRHSAAIRELAQAELERRRREQGAQ